MKPFDIEKAKAGAKVCTRDGRPVRILCYDLRGDLPIVTAIMEGDGCESVRLYRNDGRYMSSKELGSDLMLAGEEKEGWVIIRKYESGYIFVSKVHESEHEAKIKAETMANAVDVIKIEWEE